MDTIRKTQSKASRSTASRFGCLLLPFMNHVVLGVQLDIHLKLSPSGCLYQKAVTCNERLHEYSSKKNCTDDDVCGDSELVNFNHTLPHITLYLTDFDVQLPLDEYQYSYGQGTEEQDGKVGRVKHASMGSSSSSISIDELRRDLQCALEAAATSRFPFITCPLNATLASDHTSVVSGAYAMYQILNEGNEAYSKSSGYKGLMTKAYHSGLSHLQLLSDTIVNSTLIRSHVSAFAYEDIPQWVLDLPKSDPKRSIMINNVRNYGSPNVLSQFVPHLTVGYDVNGNAIERKRILDSVLGLQSAVDVRHCVIEEKQAIRKTRTTHNAIGINMQEKEEGISCSHHCREELVTEIGIGLVGDYGTVIRDLAVIQINDKSGGEKCNDTQPDDRNEVIILSEEDVDISVSS